MKTVLGILGGTGLYDLEGLKNIEKVTIASPWGQPSDQLIVGELNSIKVVFLSRHGKGHVIPPNEINFRANIDVLKRAGVTDILSLSACGSLKEELSPGTFVLVNQFIDRTVHRPASFFTTGLVAHVSLAKPTCSRLSDVVWDVLKEEDIPAHRGGTYLAMEGPQFSTYAESMLYRSWNCDVIGMTNMQEARLAREAEICYQTVAMITDYDCWHTEFGHVDVKSVLEVLHANSEKAKKLIVAATKKFAAMREPCTEGCDRALEYALCTNPEYVDLKVKEKLSPILHRVLSKA